MPCVSRTMALKGGRSCAPRSLHDGETYNNFSCFSNRDLSVLYGASTLAPSGDRHPVGVQQDGGHVANNTLRHMPGHTSGGLTSREIWLRMKDKYRNHCKSEHCWIERAKDRLSRKERKRLRSRFRPKAPRSWKQKPAQWLTNVDIERVLRQYERRYPTFFFAGVFPLDFNEDASTTNPSFSSKAGGGSGGDDDDDTHINATTCVVDSPLCGVHLPSTTLPKTRDGSTPQQWGIVLNLDRNGEPGSHWVAVFSDWTHHRVYFYDSNGKPPPTEARRLLTQLQTHHDTHHPDTPMEVVVNTRQHQFQNTECGVYAIHFITSMLDGVSFKDFVEERAVTDREMALYRRFYFRHEDGPSHARSLRRRVRSVTNQPDLVGGANWRRQRQRQQQQQQRRRRPRRSDRRIRSPPKALGGSTR